MNPLRAAAAFLSGISIARRARVSGGRNQSGDCGRGRCRLAGPAAAVLFAHGIGHAAPGDPLSDRFSLSLGGFLLDTSTDVRVDGAARTGTEIDVEEDLGFNDTERVRVDGYWRFKPRHKLRVMYFDTRRSETRVIDRTIEFREITYPVDLEVRTEFHTTVAELAYEYAFLRRERYELAGSVGIHNLQFELGLSATGATQNATFSSSASADGPLPVLGVRFL